MASERCNSCLDNYNTRDRIAKILSCLHMYCKRCLEDFMYNNGVITCLACSQETRATSLQSLPEGPVYTFGSAY